MTRKLENPVIAIRNMGPWATARQYANELEKHFAIEGEITQVWSKSKAREMGYPGVEAMIVYEGVLGFDIDGESLAAAATWHHMSSPLYWTENLTSWAIALYKKEG